jgi:hypothetical protein
MEETCTLVSNEQIEVMQFLKQIRACFACYLAVPSKKNFSELVKLCQRKELLLSKLVLYNEGELVIPKEFRELLDGISANKLFDSETFFDYIDMIVEESSLIYELLYYIIEEGSSVGVSTSDLDSYRIQENETKIDQSEQNLRSELIEKALELNRLIIDAGYLPNQSIPQVFFLAQWLSALYNYGIQISKDNNESLSMLTLIELVEVVHCQHIILKLIYTSQLAELGQEE